MESYGGKLLFSSGEVRFSSMDLLQRELLETNFSAIESRANFLSDTDSVSPIWSARYAVSPGLRVSVIGDLIVDEYINCDPLGMSQEDPTIVVTPIKEDRFVGGAGIVAAHARGLGAEVRYFGVTGSDEVALFADTALRGFGVDTSFVVDDSRPTTLKKRYRANGKTLLRVSHLRQHDISRELSEAMFAEIEPTLARTDLVIFSDFNYGCLPQTLVDRLVERCRDTGVRMVADSQASSQVGDVARFKGMRLLTPTEHEARLALRDFSSGLVVVAERLCEQAQAEQLFVTLGAEGMFVHAPENPGGRFMTDQLPAFNTSPKDPSGAGDSLLTASALALAAGADVWRSAYLGSIAAACQVSRVGNTPLTAEEVVMELQL